MVCCKTYIATYCDVSTKKTQAGPLTKLDLALDGSPTAAPQVSHSAPAALPAASAGNPGRTVAKRG